jgi:UDP-N-acetyl-D-glucosamine dehydrogenase
VSVTATALENKLRARRAVVAIVGLGYAGLPMAIELGRAGFPIIGYDVDLDKIEQVNAGKSPVSNVADEEVRALRASKTLVATSNASQLADADVAIICVPTPLTPDGGPDLRFVRSAAGTLADRLHRGMLIILQSTCGPGTTTGQLQPVLEQASGMRAGEDFFLVFAPERIDPGNRDFTVSNTPKLVGGVSEASTQLARLLFETCIDKVIPVASPEVAEMAKLVENTFRFINISFVNEMALLCDKIGVNVWEVIAAATTKPFAFMPHYPSPGVGGHCIPVVPQYLQAAAREHGLSTELIAAANNVNRSMPGLVVDKLATALEQAGKRLSDAEVLCVGVTYKPDIADIRESAAIRVIEEILARGGRVLYHDPLVPRMTVVGGVLTSSSLDAAQVARVDAVVLLTPHSTVDYEMVVNEAALVIDTHSGLRPRKAANVVNIWVPGATRPEPVEAI